jgi:hypothetical protein
MMVVLLLLLAFIAVAAGMFGLGLGLPVRDTTFGAAVLVSSSVAITGGFILAGLAAAVSELRRALQAGMRQMRPERWEAERSGGRRMEPRLVAPGATGPGAAGPVVPGADAADVIPTRFDAPEAAERPRKTSREEPAPSGAASARGPAVPPPNIEPVSERTAMEPRRKPAAVAPERFDAIRPSEYRMPDVPPPERTQAPPAAGEVNAPPLSPADTASPGAIRPVRVLKSGQINDVSYALFSDGSIETQTPEGTLRFGSIDEFRRYLEKSTG